MSIQNGLCVAKEEGKKFQSRIPFVHDLGKKIPKTIPKKFIKLTNLYPALFLAKTGCDRPRKIENKFGPEFRLYPTRARKFPKNTNKNEKIKNILPALFLAKMG